MVVKNLLGVKRSGKYFTTRRLLHLPRQIHTASSTVTCVLILIPFILALSPAVLLLMLISSLHLFSAVALWLCDETWRYNWRLGMAFTTCLGVGTLAIWLWSWAVPRGLMRTTCSSVVGAWYFAEYFLFVMFRLFLSHSLFFSSPSAPIPPPM